jgi:hypothetical protein
VTLARPGDILGNQDYQRWFTELEGTISEFGESTGTYMKDMVAYGPSRYDIIAVYEATAIVSDHPFCVLRADWVKPEQSRAARLFVDYLTGHAAQEKALLQYGFRPVDTSVPLDQPASPLNRYAANGFRQSLPPEVEVPSGAVLNTLLDFWSRNVQK